MYTTRGTRSPAWHVLFQNHVRDRELGKLSQHMCLLVRALRAPRPPLHTANLLELHLPPRPRRSPFPAAPAPPPAALAAPPPPAPRRGPARTPPPRGRPPRKRSRSAAPCLAQRPARGGSRSDGARRRAPRAPRPHAAAGGGSLPPRELRARAARTAAGSRRHSPPEGRARLPSALRTTRLAVDGRLAARQRREQRHYSPAPPRPAYAHRGTPGTAAASAK